jgi:hypothetical protein
MQRAKEAEAPPVARPYFYPWYLATLGGGSKIVQAVCAFVCRTLQRACAQVGSLGTLTCIMLINGAAYGTYAAAAAALAGFVISLILLVMHVYNLVHLCTLIDIPFWVCARARTRAHVELQEYMYTGAWIGAYAVTCGYMTYSAIVWKMYSIQWGAAAVGTRTHVHAHRSGVRTAHVRRVHDRLCASDTA